MVILGEILALCASLVWTVSSLSAEVSSKRIGALSLNTIAMFFAFLFLNIALFCFTGLPFPQYLDAKALYWTISSGIFGYAICNYFLFTAYALIGYRFVHFVRMITIPSATLVGWIFVHEKLT